MSTATKNIRTLLAVTTQAATVSFTSSTFDLSTALAGTISARIVNTSTGPTIAASVRVDLSIDGGTTWRTHDLGLAATTAAAIYDYVFDLPESYKTARVVFAGNTAQPVTVECYGHELTSIS